MAVPTAPSERGSPALSQAIAARLRQVGRQLAAPVGSVLFALLAGAILIAVTGSDPFAAYASLFCGGLGIACSGNVFPALQVSETLVYGIPLILTGLAVAVSFRAGLFNIGAEGQLIMGAIATTFVGVKFGNLPGFLLLPLVLIAGALAGAVWGGIVGVLKATTGANEVVTTIMLNYVAQSFLLFLIVGGPLQLPNASSTSPSIAKGAELPTLISPTSFFLGLPGGVYRLHAGIWVALAAAVVLSIVLRRLSLGYEIRAVGQSQKAAKYAGVSVRKTIIVTMLISGAFAGLAGAVQIAGLRHNLTNTYLTDTTGFDAIAVTLLGQNTAIGVVISAILFGALHVGGQFMQGASGVSSNLVEILQAFILFSIAANFLRTFKFRLPALGRRPGNTDVPIPIQEAATTTDEDIVKATDTGATA